MSERRVEAMDTRTSELIAAAYVVPDLVVAVQEAVYNAIDANAKRVCVVLNAAQGSFSVSDDGDGIHPDEMTEHIFQVSASSKRDDQARKYGRRGQFLLAVANMAKEVELESRVKGHWTSYRKVAQDARIVFNARSTRPRTSKGSLLRVQSLFWLLPVRQRDLEAHSSARARLAKRLSSFCQSLSMIWPTLSIDVSFSDAKVPRCIVSAVVTCEERLRGVFGTILGSDLEYLSYDVNESPFTIRGYLAVLRDGGDGDAYLESAGWRQARAYYQFVFLDNLWLDDFHLECCKKINSMAISEELGIPIFVLKISAKKSNEYELHSDGHTRIANMKHPELLTQTLHGFVQMLKARIVDAEASAPSNPGSSSTECPDVKMEPSVTDGACALDTLPCSGEEYPSESWIRDYRDSFCGVGDACGGLEEEEKAEWTEGLSIGYSQESAATSTAEYLLDSSFFSERNALIPRISYKSEVYDSANHQQIESMAINAYGMYEAEPEPQETAYFAEEYSETDQARQVFGCSRCTSCSNHVMQPSTYDEDPTPTYAIENLANGPQAGVYFVYDGYEVSESRGEYATATYPDGVSFDGVKFLHSSARVRDRSEVDDFDVSEQQQTSSHLEDHEMRSGIYRRELDRIFFRRSSTSEQQQANGRQWVQQPESEAAWISSRRVGVAELAQKLQDPAESGSEERSNQGADERHAQSQDVEDTHCGSAQLSNYFSLEKMAQAHKRSIGPSISRFAMKRAAFSGSVRLSRLEDAPSIVSVKHLPSDIHSTSAKSMTLDKSMFQHLQVIKQVDRKFILVKVKTKPSGWQPPNGDNSDSSVSEPDPTLLLCIDQHAADERVRLEYLEAQVFGASGDERNMKTMAHDPALVLSLNDRERETVSFFSDEIRAWGFGVELDSHVAMLTRTPQIDTRVAGADDFREYLQLLTRSDAVVARRVLRPPVITRFLHSRACRSAIMFGDYLSFSQCEDIIEQLSQCKLPFQCAHGRPSIVPLVELM